MNSDSTSRYDPRQGAGRKSLGEILSRYKVAENGCWEWTGAQNQFGYGLVNMWISGRQTTFAPHRLQWMHTHGDPGEMVVMHKCDNRVCLNPDHLRLGTTADNVRDCVAKGRFRGGNGDWWDRYRRNEVPYMGKYHRERFPDYVPYRR